jgi:hypothetical protein
MSAGTITLTNGSAVVGGTGTSFTTELAAGDFIVSTVGGVPYTLPVKTVESNTQLTLVSNFTGPTQSGAAWSAVPRVALNMVTAALVAQSAEALRGLNYDKQNWQHFFRNRKCNGNCRMARHGPAHHGNICLTIWQPRAVGPYLLTRAVPVRQPHQALAQTSV